MALIRSNLMQPTDPLPAPVTAPTPARSRLGQSAWWLLTLSYYVTVCLAHLQFSLWLVRRRDGFFGRIAFADLVPGVAVVLGLLLVGWIALQLRHGARAWRTGGLWLLWLVLAALVDGFLTYSINETVHYPQYAILAWLLARAMDPGKTRWLVGRVLFWSTLMGIGDELLQYLWITTTYSDYLDFNDFLTNLLASAAGMLLYYGSAALPALPVKRPKPVISWLAAGLISAGLTIGLQSGRIVQTPTEKIPPGGIVATTDGRHVLYLQRGPEFYGSTQNGPRHGQYHVLSPLPALLIMLGIGLVFAGYGRFRPGPGQAFGPFAH